MIAALLVIAFIACSEPPENPVLFIPSVSEPESFGRNNLLDFWTLRKPY